MILDFQTNNLTTVEMVDKGLWRIVARTDDSLFSGEAVLDVMTPALDIRRAELTTKRDVLGLSPDLNEPSEKLVGIRVGPGMTKIIRGVLGGDSGSDRMAELVLEAMEMLINGLTTPELRKAMTTAGESVKFDHDGPLVYLNDVTVGDEHVKVMGANPRLKDSCVAFRNL